MPNNWLMFDRKKGLLGIKKYIGNQKQLEKEMGSNFMVTLIDPINFKELENVQLHSNDYDWHELPKDDPRVLYWRLFSIIYDADWRIYAHCCNEYCDGHETEVDESCIENEHEVFQQVRELFGR